VRAIDHQHGRVVALKVRPVEDDSERETLLAEARILLSLPPHPGLPLVREDFFWEDGYVLVMDWVAGTDLGQVLADTGDPGLGLGSVVDWLGQAADALGHLHAQGVVHGDVKPANLVLTPGGRILLVDFGVSRRHGDLIGENRGSPGYSAPELHTGAAGPAADVYSLAATAVALLTGSPPSMARPDWTGVPHAVAVERVLRRGLAFDPDRRPRSASELVERLRSQVEFDLPTGIVTFLATEIEGSTARWEADGHAMSQLVARHNAAVADAVESCGGRLLRMGGEGEATFSVFTRASDAVVAALTAQIALQRDVGPVVRMAIHTGEAELREREYYGTAVIRARRLRSTADAGQVILSGAAADLVSEALPVGASLADLGMRELRELSRAERVFALEHADLGDWPVGVRVGPARAPAATSDASHPPTVAAPAPIAAVGLPPGLAAARAPVFVGRQRELDVLMHAWKDACAGRRRVILLTGEPGSGKTQLSAEAAARAQEGGGSILFGRNDEGLQVPFQPFAEALRQAVNDAAGIGRRPVLGRMAGELIRLVPDLAAQVPGLPPPLQADPQTEQFRMFEAVASWLREASVVHPLVLVLGELQWATPPTLHLLRHVVRAAETASLLVIGTFRDSEVGRSHPLAELLADAHRVPGVDELHLTGLDVSEVVELIERAAGHSLGDRGRLLAELVRAETAGNPFFVREVLRHLVETGVLVQGDDGQWVVGPIPASLGIPVGVREVVGSRLSRLGENARVSLEVAAVTGVEFSLPVVAGAAGIDEELVLEGLEEARGARLLVESGPLRFRFSHSLVQATILDGVNRARRSRIHRRIAETIERLNAGKLDDQLIELARHYAGAAASGGGAKAVEYAARAGDLASERLEYDEAAACYWLATELLTTTEEVVDEQQRCRLLLLQGQAQRHAGDRAYRETLLEAADVAIRWRDPELLSAAALANRRTGLMVRGAPDPERVEVLEAAIDLLPPGDSDVRARLLAQLAVELTAGGDRSRRLALSAEAVSIARRLGDPATLAAVLVLRSETIWHPSTLEERADLAAEQLALAVELGDRSLEGQAALNAAAAAAEAVQIDDVHRHLERATVIITQPGRPALRWQVAVLAARDAIAAGRFADAERLTDDARELGETAGQPEAGLVAGAQRVALRYWQGRLAELRAAQEAEAARNPDRFFQLVVALTDAETGRSTAAASTLERLAADGFAWAPEDSTWCTLIGVSSMVAARSDALGPMPMLYDLLAPYRHHLAIDRANVVGAVAHLLGLLASRLGRFAEADALFTEALDVHRRLGAPTLVAASQLAFAESLFARGETAYEGRLRNLVDGVRGIAADVGMALVGARADFLAGRLLAGSDRAMDRARGHELVQAAATAADGVGAPDLANAFRAQLAPESERSEPAVPSTQPQP
jgi:predicted ATPase